MAEIVLEMIALILERIERLLFDAPASPCPLHEPLHRAWLREPTIEKAGVIVSPGNASKPAPQEAFGAAIPAARIKGLCNPHHQLSLTA